MSTSTGQLGSDEAILWQVPVMCDLLGVKRINPTKIWWKDVIYLGRGSGIPVPVDYLIIGSKRMILAQRMQGVLSPDEWKPLIGSSLLIKSWAGPRFRKALVWGIIIGLIYYIPILLLATLTSVFGPASFLLANPAFALVIGLIALAITARRSSPAAHVEALKADLKIAGLLGRDTFLAVLQKIESMGFREVEKLDRKRSRFKQPSVQERIQNLQTGGSPALVS